MVYMDDVINMWGKILASMDIDKISALVKSEIEILVVILGYNNYNYNRNILVIFNYIINLDFFYLVPNLALHALLKLLSIDELDLELKSSFTSCK